MITINGRVYSGNVEIVNGRVVSDGTSNESSSKKFDETKKESSNGINQISISSNIANVRVYDCKTDDIVAHLHGYSIMDGDITLSLTKVNGEIQILVMFDKTSRSNTISMNNSVVINNFISCSNNGLTIDVSIPDKVFEKLYIQSNNSNINVTKAVNVKNIQIYNQNGNIDVTASFQYLNINCNNGNIYVNSEATCDIRLSLCTTNGNTDVSISNIGTSNVLVDSKNGYSKNTPRLRGSLTASGYIISTNGNLNFH